MSSSSSSPNFDYSSNIRSREENQERAFIAASRRKDRSLDARLESAQRASMLHKQRTGKALNITKEIVENEDMYEEVDVRQQGMEIRLLQAQNDRGEDQFYNELLTSLRLRSNNINASTTRRPSSVSSRPPPANNPNGVRRHSSDYPSRRSHIYNNNNGPISAVHPLMSAPPVLESYPQELQSQQMMPPLPPVPPYFSLLDFNNYSSLPNINLVPQAPFSSYAPPSLPAEPQAEPTWPAPPTDNWPFLQENTSSSATVAPPQDSYLDSLAAIDFASELDSLMAFDNEEDPDFDGLREFATALGTNVLPEGTPVPWQAQ